MNFLFTISFTNTILVVIAIELLIAALGLSKKLSILEMLVKFKDKITPKDINHNKNNGHK